MAMLPKQAHHIEQGGEDSLGAMFTNIAVLYLRGIFQDPSECLKPKIVLNPIYAVLFPTHTSLL
jgi:hypothetical protein